jgi:hypothetical protein
MAQVVEPNTEKKKKKTVEYTLQGNNRWQFLSQNTSLCGYVPIPDNCPGITDNDAHYQLLPLSIYFTSKYLHC